MDQNDHHDSGSVLSPTTTTSLLSHDSNHNPEAENIDQHSAFIVEFTPNHVIPQHEDDEFITTLLIREKGYRFGSPANLSHSDKACIEHSRLESIQWILQNRLRLEFGYRTAYLSIMYFDRFLSLQWTALKGKDWAIRLLAVTCLSLAAKMEEVKYVALSAYEFSYGTEWIKRMELKVLRVLHWNMRFVSPFPFVEFFRRNLFPECCGQEADVVSRSALIIFQAATVNSTMDYKPSVMAMAATLLVVDKSLTKAAVKDMIYESAVSSYGLAATYEQVHCCYEMLKSVQCDNRASLVLGKSPSSLRDSEVNPKRNKLNSDES